MIIRNTAREGACGTRLTVRDQVGFGRYPYSQGRPRPADRTAIAAALKEFDLDALAGRFLDELSGGQRQGAFVAMVFVQATGYLLLDEPLNDLDPAFARALVTRLRALASEHGRTIVVVMHDVNYASAWADRIVALKDGEIAATGTPGTIVQPEVLQRIFDLEITVARVGGMLVALHHEMPAGLSRHVLDAGQKDLGAS